MQEITKELEKFHYMNETLMLTQKKKDLILTVAHEENRKLREEIDNLKNTLKNRNLLIEKMKKENTFKEQINIKKPEKPKEIKMPICLKLSIQDQVNLI